jgi:hypothetical protein
MAFTPPPKRPSYEELQVTLNNSKILVTNQALYQTISALIHKLSQDQSISVKDITTINNTISDIVADIINIINGGPGSGAVTLAGTPDYITIAAQVITRHLINLTTHVTDRLPFANLTAATAQSILLGRRSGSAGDFEEIDLGTNLSMSGTTLNASGGASGYWAPLTDGDVDETDLIFAGGDTIMVFIPV